MARTALSCLLCLLAQLALSCGDPEAVADGDAGSVSDGGSAHPPSRSHDKHRDDDAGSADMPSKQPSAAGAMSQGGSGGKGTADPRADAGMSTPRDDDAGGAPAANMQSAASTDMEAVMLQTVYGFGVGGSVSLDFHPVVLFKDGTVCRDVNFLVQNLSAEQHRSMFPNRWTHWKTIDGKVALESGQGKWTKLDTQLRYPPMPQGATLEGVFKRLTGGGDTAFGGDTVIAVESSFGFSKDHRFARGASSALISSNAAVGSAPADQLGSYAFDGYHATLTYDSGEVVDTSVVWTAADPQLVFLGGRSFVMGD